MSTRAVTIVRPQPAECPGLCEPVIRSVPEWFGIEESTRGYIEMSGRLPTWVAMTGATPVRAAGFVTIRTHFRHAAEIHCIAVHKEFHGQGVGTALVQHIELVLRAEGVRVLQVKTMGPSKPNAEYALTHKFYTHVGFTELEEFHNMPDWGGLPCLVLIKPI
jgi:ribosomal protein S18 acetylase RimI-like enzyme